LDSKLMMESSTMQSASASRSMIGPRSMRLFGADTLRLAIGLHSSVVRSVVSASLRLLPQRGALSVHSWSRESTF
jgi:hypothetical protein